MAFITHNTQNHSMHEEPVLLRNSEGRGFVIALGSVNLVGVVTARGMLGCGAIDVTALDTFKYPAARVRPAAGPSISTVEDLLVGTVKDANIAAQELGVAVGMSGREALDILS